MVVVCHVFPSDHSDREEFPKIVNRIIIMMMTYLILDHVYL